MWKTGKVENFATCNTVRAATVYNKIIRQIWCLRWVSEKVVHWRYNFQTTKDIEMIFGDLLIWYISSSGKMFKHVAFMCYQPFNMATLGCYVWLLNFWVTLEVFRRHGKRQIKHFDFGVEYKPNGRTCKFQYQWLEILCRLEEIYIEASVAFLKCFSIDI